MTRTSPAPSISKATRTCILIAAYDAGLQTSEGHVARSLLARLDPDMRVILITRRNNVAELKASPDFAAASPNVQLIGFDLPRWAAWWKKGARGYGLYAYLWQSIWPFVLKRRRLLLRHISIVHTLNFHNDSIPNMGWILGRPSVWGPINHHEIAPAWRREIWPHQVKHLHVVKFFSRRILWRLDPFLRLALRRTDKIFCAGPWVTRRLAPLDEARVIMRSQLGIAKDLAVNAQDRSAGNETVWLICPGRLDWIKGVDIAIEAMALLPNNVQLEIIGDGPAERMLRNLAESHQLSARVHFMPPMDRNALFARIARCDLLLFPSAEVAGLIWIEALGCGTPVIAFDGITEIATTAREIPGITLASTGTSRKEAVLNYANAIRSAAEKPVDHAEIASRAVNRYSWASLAEHVQDTYRRAVEIE
ncbi:glycosyltransferase [Arsenicitalea aurantiaca]|uniref:Glycosyltransferase n=1 Tax=Arsenicitalea aurantiaca TaxID=1783274 RepID=A0A433X790_9HYPH|nr:glycosyltransferase [Arsenicitalea aurantiaca]RUT29967.1 glycosyltransferase [Arsenicitalea aurantiaca]